MDEATELEGLKAQVERELPAAGAAVRQYVAVLESRQKRLAFLETEYQVLKGTVDRYKEEFLKRYGD